MSRQWKPGDVVEILHDVDDIVGRAIRTKDNSWYCVPFDEGDCTHHGDTSQNIKSIRPLVVVDPEDREQVERVAAAYVRERGFPREQVSLPGRADDMQAALRSLVADPKPEEPTGLGAVVRDSTGATWVQAGRRGDWYQAHVKWSKYTDIDAVEVLSEGVQP